MKLILNADAISAPLSGIGRYTWELATRLPRHADVEQLSLFSANRWFDTADQVLDANRMIASARRALPFKGLLLRAYGIQRSLAYRFTSRHLRGHLLHSPNYILMPHDGPSVTTVHDLSILRFPQYHPRERVEFMKRHMRKSIDQAQAIITDAKAIRDEVIAEYGLDPKRVHAVPLGVDSAYHPRPAEALQQQLDRWQLKADGYLLSVATLEPRKNLAGLLDAWQRLSPNLRRRYPLCLAGPPGWLNEALENRLRSLEQKGEIRRLGFVAESELPLLYSAARAFALPSFYEGFGLPVLEAMASGVPVLTSNCSSLPEVAGGAGLLVDPNDDQALLLGLQTLLEDEPWRAQARARGLQRATELSWERCVDATVDVYRTAIGSTR